MTEPLTVSDFCKYEGLDADAVLALPFGQFCELIKKHGFFLSGSGLIPKDYGATISPKRKRTPRTP